MNKYGAAALIAATIVGQTAAQTRPLTLYPWAIDYHQTLTMKLTMVGCSWDDEGSGTRSIDQTLTEVVHRDNLTRGIPKIIYLSGWMRHGNDAEYPDFSHPNPFLKRPQDRSAADALTWLINEAKKRNTIVSFHINQRDAYDNNPVFTEFKDSGCIGGKLGNWCAGQSWEVISQCAVKKGLSQKRIDALINVVPGLSTVAKTIHSDVFHRGEPIGRTDMAIYWRQKWGMDVTSEGTSLPRYVPMIWHWTWASIAHPPAWITVPYIQCGGDGENGALGTSINAQYWGANEGRFLKEFCENTLPWYYLNRLIRISISKDSSTATFSNDVVSTATTIKRSGEFIRDGNDLFVPALWRSGKEIISYSESGFSNRSWKMPPEWGNVASVDIYNITTNGLVSARKGAAIQSGRLTLSVAAGKAVSIVPAGADPEAQPVVPPSGTAAFTGIDSTTRGSWIGAFGNAGYSLSNGTENLPSGVTLSYVGGTNQTWAATTADNRGLQTPGDPSTRFASRRETVNHFVVDVDCGATKRDIALYFVDWRNEGRAEILDVMDINNYKRLDTKIISNFSQGKYVRYNISGRVQFRITRLPNDDWYGPNAGVSGVFFGGTSAIRPPRNAFSQTLGLGGPGAAYNLELYSLPGVLIRSARVSDTTTHGFAATVSRAFGPLARGSYIVRINENGGPWVEHRIEGGVPK
jgi:hypothetical protein